MKKLRVCPICRLTVKNPKAIYCSDKCKNDKKEANGRLVLQNIIEWIERNGGD